MRLMTGSKKFFSNSLLTGYDRVGGNLTDIAAAAATKVQAYEKAKTEVESLEELTQVS